MITKELATKVLKECLATGADFAEIFYEVKKANTIAMVSKMIKNSDTSVITGVGIRILKDLQEVKESKNAFSIIHGDFVTTEDGTGIVHTAPGFGEDDNNVCKPLGIPTVCPVDDGGCFTNIVNDFEGIQVFETNDSIIIKLKEEGKWLKTEQYIHNYPHCWRTDTPLIYRAMSSWYVNIQKIKDKLLKNNQLINWMPEHLKNGRFGKWLEGARDWSISRNRFFGCPIPVWKSTDPNYPRIDVYGSIAELEKDFGVKITDLHRPYIDELTRKNPDDPTGKSIMKRIPDVLDCWFESGSMPYAQLHYPFENKEYFENNFPADFITEGDQTRGWFYCNSNSFFHIFSFFINSSFFTFNSW